MTFETSNPHQYSHWVCPLSRVGYQVIAVIIVKISSILIVTKALALTVLHRLKPISENNVPDQEAGFHLGRGCIDQILTL